MFNNFFSPEPRAVYEIMWKKYGRSRRATEGNIIRRMRIACWISKAIDRHSNCVILTAFPRQQVLTRIRLFFESHYTYHVACLLCFYMFLLYWLSR